MFPTLLKEYHLSSVPKPLAPLALITPENQNKELIKYVKDKYLKQYNITIQKPILSLIKNITYQILPDLQHSHRLRK